MDKVSGQALREKVSELARINGIARKLDNIGVSLGEIPSSDEEMKRDWCSAIGTILRWVLTGPRPFAFFEESCFDLLAQAWLDDVKEATAYHVWEVARSKDGIWCADETRASHYFMACDEVNKWLLGSKHKADWKREGRIVERYIDTRFLEDGKLRTDGDEVTTQVDRKAKRFARLSGSGTWIGDGRQIAREYVVSFYENIIPAIEGRVGALRDVVKALSYGTEAGKNSLLVNGFEAALAIKFLPCSGLSALELDGAHVL